MNTRERLLALLALCLCLAGSMTFTACEETEEEQGGENTEDVVNPTKIVGYEGSKQFTSDLEALVDYGCAVYAMRLAFWNVASNDFRTGELFCATLKDIDKNTTSIYDFYDLASTIVEPGLTSVAQPLQEMGEKAAACLLRQLEGFEPSDTTVMLEGRLIIRPSSLRSRPSPIRP